MKTSVKVQTSKGKFLEGELTDEHDAGSSSRLALIIDGVAYARLDAAIAGYHVIECDDDECFEEWNNYDNTHGAFSGTR